MKIKCLRCDDIIESYHRHDFKFCKCGNVHIDGGKDYLKYGVVDKDTIKFIKDPIILVRVKSGQNMKGCPKCYFWKDDDCNFFEDSSRIISGNTICNDGTTYYYFKEKK